MKRALVAIMTVFVALAGTARAEDYASELAAWRKRVDDNLRKDLGWLTIAGRWELKSGPNRVGSAANNDIVLPKELAPARLGVLHVGKDAATLKLERGTRMWAEPEPGQHGVEFTERTLNTSAPGEEWISSGRLSMNVFKREDGKTILRIADRESPNRKRFVARVWYPPNAALRVPATFVPYAPGTKIPIANVRGEITEEDAAGHLDFDLLGKPTRLDVFSEDDGRLFVIVRDATSGSTTYPAGRFVVADKPVDGKTVLDLNKAYNPPCAFSAYTTCPLPPPQNWLKVAIEAGEKYPSLHAR